MPAQRIHGAVRSAWAVTFRDLYFGKFNDIVCLSLTLGELIMTKLVKPWDKPNTMARKCDYCKSQKPGMQPLRLKMPDGTIKRAYWHLKCFEKVRNIS